MSEQPLISVIVPVYNVEKYLRPCVESILEQTYKNIEVILVNDGSTDKSKAICLELAEKDKRISYYEKANSGLSDTRNVGLEKATGDYILFVDSDDLLSFNAIESLYKLCKKYNADIAVESICHFTDGKRPDFKGSTKDKLLNREEAICDFLYQKEISTSACGKLYSASILSGIRFKSGILYEDNLFLSDVFECVDKVPYSKQECYGYRHRANSITTKLFSEKDLDIIDIGKELLRRYEYKSKELSLAVHTYQVTNCLRVYLTEPGNERFKNDINYCREYIELHKKETLKNSKARNKLKIALLIMRLPRKMVIRVRQLNKRWN